jgi:hypothetical protein
MERFKKHKMGHSKALTETFFIVWKMLNCKFLEKKFRRRTWTINSQLLNLNSNMSYRLAIEQVWHENQEESSNSNKP